MDRVTFKSAFPYVVGGCVIAAIVAGLALIGSPWTERSRRLDRIRVMDLSQLAQAIDRYWKQEWKLPASFDALATVPEASFRSTMDPSTAEPVPVPGDRRLQLRDVRHIRGGQQGGRIQPSPSGSTPRAGSASNLTRREGSSGEFADLKGSVYTKGSGQWVLFQSQRDMSLPSTRNR